MPLFFKYYVLSQGMYWYTVGHPIGAVPDFEPWHCVTFQVIYWYILGQNSRPWPRIRVNVASWQFPTAVPNSGLNLPAFQVGYTLLYV